ncbi:hypothetical protein PA3071 [hydrothermal vent metagenome]|uniref:VWFA domain-containing protein n=1 Tax=hydrothermal vent metagenome TaxID=652676 RepID=A0A3B1CBJ1_9ZZZZ
MKPAVSSNEEPDEEKLAEVIQRIRRIEIKTRRIVDNVFSGEYHSAFKGRGMEFAESRPYQPGDDVRVMDWKVTARTGDPFVKVFREEREMTLMLVCDFSGSNSFGSHERFKEEVAADLCAALAFSAIKNNDKVGLIAFTDRVELFIAPKKGRTHVLRLIRELLFYKPNSKGTDIGQALEYMNRVTKKRSITFLVSDFHAEEYKKQLSATAKKHDLIAVRLVDPREEVLPDVGYITLKDAETGLSCIVNTSDKKLRDDFQRTIALETKERDRLFASCRVDQVVIRSDRSYVEPLIRFFKERERRRSFG